MNLNPEEYRINSLGKITERQLIEVFETTEAVKTDHYKLVGGHYSDRFFDLNAISRNPRLLGKITDELIDWISNNIKSRFDIVLSPITGGRVLAFDLVREFNGTMNSIAAYAQVNLEDSIGRVLPILTESSRIENGDKVLIISDIITSGGGIKAMETIIDEHNAELVGIVAVASRSDEGRACLNEIAKRHNVKTHTLIDFFWENWPDDRSDKLGPATELGGGLIDRTEKIVIINVSQAAVA